MDEVLQIEKQKQRFRKSKEYVVFWDDPSDIIEDLDLFIGDLQCIFGNNKEK